MIHVKNSTQYYINERALTFSENDLDDPHRVAVSLVSGTVILVHVPGTIDFASDGNYERWTLRGYSTKLVKNDAHSIYARLSRTDRTALIVFSVNKYNIDGSITTENEADGSSTTTDPSSDYFYIQIGELTATDGRSDRELTYDSGLLSTKKGDSMTDSNAMWELLPGTNPLIRALHWLTDFTVKGYVKLIGGLKFSKGQEGDDKVVSDIKRSTDSDHEHLLDENGEKVLDENGNPVPNPNYVPVSDETIPTTAYVKSVTEDKFLRKDQGDYTPHDLGVGGKTTAEGGIQIGAEFVPGLTGWGANIDKHGQAELESLFIRTFLEVPELRYNRVTVRMGDEINSVAAGIIESVSPETGTTGTLTLKLEDGEFGPLEPDDLVMQIFSDMVNRENNSEETSDDGKGNRYMKGFATVMFRVISVSGDRNQTIAYELREVSPAFPKPLHPYAMGPFVQRGNRSDAERQTIVYQGIYPEPYTRYMKGVNDWEFTSAMIGMQIGSLENMSVFGMDMSGYSAYVDNIYYTGFSFELTPQQKVELSAYTISLSEYVGSVRVDSEGNIIGGEYRPLNVVSGDGNVVAGDGNVTAGDYLLQTQIQVFKGGEVLAYTPDMPGKGHFTASISPVGCTAVVANGVVCITGVTDFEYSYVDINVNCEGTDVTWNSSYQIKVIKDGASALYADIDNEMDSVACDEEGNVLFGLPVSCNVGAWYGQRRLDIKGIALDVPDGVTAEADAATGKVEVTDIAKESADILQIGIAVSVELFGVSETRNLTFTVNKVKQGESALLYKLLPSVDSVKVNDAGTPDVTEVSCRVLKVNSQGAEELPTLEETGLTMQYRTNKGAFADYTYGDGIAIAEETQSVSFRLYMEGTLMDVETVPVVKDGNAIKQVGEFYLATSYGYGEGVTREDGPWGTWVEGSIPELSKERKYLWNYEAISYTGMDATYTEPTIIAWWTEDGKGVKEVHEWYQVNNDKDNAPGHPHVEGDKWVRDKAPAMTEEAKYLWNYEEVVWTDGSVTYTEPAMIGAKGETGATTPVLTVSHAAITRNSLGVFDPRHVIVTSTRGTEREETWMTMYGLTADGDVIIPGNNTVYASQWNIDLQSYSEAFDKAGCKSLVFRSYPDETIDYKAPYLANTGITFVQDGEVGEHGPMPRNRGRYDGSTEYFYDDEYRDYVWMPGGYVFLRKGRGYTSQGATKGSIVGEEPIPLKETDFWIPASVQALTAINTALIDEADIAGFVFKESKMVSRDFNYDSGELDATIILDGVNGFFKCNNAEVKGLITVENIEYDIQNRSDGPLVKSAMVVGPGEFVLPAIQEGYTMEIKALYPTVESRTALPPFKFGHSQGSGGFILFYDSETRWGKFYDEVTLEPNILYTFMSYNDSGVYRWMLTSSTGEGAPGSAPIVDSKLDVTSTNPVQNKVITGEIERIGPVVYNKSKGYWKLDGDLLVTGGVSMYSSDTAFDPYTVTDAVLIDHNTIKRDPLTGALMINPNLDFGGGGLDDVKVTGSGNAVTSASLSGNVLTLTKGSTFIAQSAGDGRYVLASAYTADDVMSKIQTKDGAGSGLDADKLDGYDLTKFPLLNAVFGSGKDVNDADRAGYYNVSLAANLPSGMYNYGMLETIEVHSAVSDSEKRTAQIYVPHISSDQYGNYALAVRMRNGAANATNNVWGEWRKVPTESGNIASATKLRNARTIWGQSFDGTANVTGALSGATTGAFSDNVSMKSATIDGVKITKSQSGVLFLDGNLVVSGGITMFGTNSVTASTVMDGVNVDGTTIIKSGGKLMLNPNLELGGGLDESALASYLSTNKYLTQTTGDARYVTAIGTSGNDLTYTKNGTTQKITVPYATTAKQLSSWKVLSITKTLDGGTVYKLIADLSNWKTTYNGQWGMVGVMYGHRGGNMAGTAMQNIVAYCAAYSSSGGAALYELKTDVASYVRPCIVEYGGKNYLALRMSGSGSNREHSFLGYTENLLDEFIEVAEGNATLVHDTETMTMTYVSVGSATRLGSSNIGSTNKPIYLSSGSPTEGSTYAGGTAVTLNGESKGASTASFYAPTGVGTSGYVLKSNGTSAPTWVAQSSLSVGSATSATKLSTTSAYTAWGRTYWNNGVPASISGDMTGVGNITMSGHLYLNGANSSSSTSNKTQILFGTSSTVTHVAVSSNTSALVINPTASTTTGQIVLGVNGKNTSFISSGNFGIGVENPEIKLHVQGDIGNSQCLMRYSETQPYFKLTHTYSGTSYNHYITSTEGVLKLGKSLSVGLSIDNDGKVTASSGFIGNYLTLKGGYSSAISSKGWYRFATSTTHNAHCGQYVFFIRRSYNFTNNESYMVSCTVDYGKVHWTQLNGHANTRLITQLRCTYTNDSTIYFDFYYNGTVSNTVWVDAIGNCSLQTPAVTTSTLTSTVTFDLGDGMIVGGNLLVKGGVTMYATSSTSPIEEFYTNKLVLTETNNSSAFNEKGILFGSNGVARIGVNSSNGLAIYAGANIYLRPNSLSAPSSVGMVLETTGNAYLSGGLTIGATSSNAQVTNGTYKLYVTGKAYVTSTLTQNSDIRFKDIHKDLRLSLATMAEAPSFEYHFTDDERKDTHIGTSAQYWQNVDGVVREGAEGRLGMDYASLGVVMGISLAKELSRYESATDKEIRELKERIIILENELNECKNK